MVFILRLNGKADKTGRARCAEILSRLGLSDRLHNLSVVLADEPRAPSTPSADSARVDDSDELGSRNGEALTKTSEGEHPSEVNF